MTTNILLLIVAFVCARGIFFLIDDPEGPNLLIVTVLALVLYTILRMSWCVVHRYVLKSTEEERGG